MRTRTCALVSLMLVLGCTGEELDASGDPIGGPTPLQAGGTSDESAGVVSYEVPLPAGSELEEFAVFPMDEVRLRARRGRVQLEYLLPAELTGLPRVKIEVEGDDVPEGQDLHLGGDDGYALCRPTFAGHVCSVDYDELDLDVARAMAYVQSAHPEVDVAPRVEVAGIFADDPLGLIHGVRLQRR